VSKVAQSHVWHKEKEFFVSTINRESSAALAYGATYSETIVWEWNPVKNERGAMIGRDEHCADSLFAHQRMVQRIFDTGNPDVPDDD
jgi:hypothetical protein